jgi:PAS domain S-box-containing protein
MALLERISDAAWCSEGGVIKAVNHRFRQWAAQRHAGVPEGRTFWGLLGQDNGIAIAQWFDGWRESGLEADCLMLDKNIETAGPCDRLWLFRLGPSELGLLTMQEELDPNLQILRHAAIDLLGVILARDNTSVIVGTVQEGPRIHLVHADDRALELLELSHPDIPAFDLLPRIKPTDRPRVAEAFRQATKAESIQTLEVDMVAGGEAMEVEMTLGPVVWHGDPCAFAVIRDTTVGAVLVSELRRYAAAFEALQDTVVLADGQFNVIYVNPSGLERSGYTLDEVFGKPLMVFAAMRDDEQDVPSAEKSLLTTGHWHGQRWAVRKDGAQYPVDIIATLQRDSDGSVSTVTLVSRDISLLKANETNLLRARERAEFLRDLMSHDINNYVQGVIGRIELLSRTGLSEQQSAHAREALAQAHRTSELVARVRNLALAQKAKVLTAIPLAQTIEDCTRSLRLKYSGVQMVINVGPSLAKSSIRADELLIELITNVMDNAVKHSTLRPVVIDVSAEPRWIGNHLFWRLVIADNGPGIPDEMKETLFFQRIRKTDHDEDAGLGLSLVLALVERYSGRIWIEDRVDGDWTQGARFVMELPAG